MKEDNNIFEKIFLFVMLSCIGLGLYVLVSSFNIRNVRNEIRKEFIKEAVSLGCIEYKIVNKITGETSPHVIIPKTKAEAEKMSEWLNVPLYSEVMTISSDVMPIQIASVGYFITGGAEK